MGLALRRAEYSDAGALRAGRQGRHHGDRGAPRHPAPPADAGWARSRAEAVPSWLTPTKTSATTPRRALPISRPKRPDDAKPWLALISDAEHCFEKYHTKCDTIDDLYAKLDLLGNTTADREFKIFWANMCVMMPSIYARPPIPVVVPKFKDRTELARRASELLERALISVTDANDGQLHEAMKLVRHHLAIHARGVMWLRNSDTMVEFDQLDRGDFLHEPARKW